MRRHAVGWTSYTPVTSGTSVSYGGNPAPVPGPEPGRPPELADVGRLWRRAVRGVVGAARADERPSLARIIGAHLGDHAEELAVVGEEWPAYEHVNVQAALDALTAQPGMTADLVGMVGYQHHQFGLAELMGGGMAGGFGFSPGSVSRINVASGPDGAVTACVLCGIYLLAEEDARSVILFRGPEPTSGMPSVVVQIVSTTPGRAAGLAARLRELALRNNVFRGQVVSFGGEMFGPHSTVLTFHRRPEMTADQLILDPEAVASIERQVTGIARHSARLIESGQHLKRGLLLYGPPGVGKTHTVRLLTAQLTGTTVIQLTANALHLIGEACQVARALQPSMVVVEDVDLIAEDRGMHPGQHPLLFQLLNEMDGLAEDADVLFVLTTNRADLLEPALAARPGRIDQAVELPLPDLAARRRLFELYRGRLVVDTDGLDTILAATEGSTASLIKELLRRAAVRAAERTPDDRGPLRVSGADLRGALDELLASRNALTRVIVGGAGMVAGH